MSDYYDVSQYEFDDKSTDATGLFIYFVKSGHIDGAVQCN